MSVIKLPLRGRRGWGRPGVRPSSSFDLVAMGLGVVFVAAFAFPLVNLASSVLVDDGSLRFGAALDVLAEDGLASIVRNTVTVVSASGLLAVVIGTMLAWLTERTDARWGWTARVFAIIPLMLPPIALAIGWYFLAEARTGFLNALLRKVLGLSGEGPLDIGTWPGLVWVYTLYLVPFVYLTMSAAFRNLDPALEEASKMSGSSDWRTFWRVSVPAVRPALGSSILLVVISGTALFSVPTVIGTDAGIEVLSVHIVRVIRFSYPPRLFDGAVLSVLMMLVLGAAWVVQRRLASGQRHARIAGKSSGSSLVRLGPWKWVARGLMLVFLLLSSVVPLVALVVVSLQPYWSPTIDSGELGLDNFRQLFAGSSGSVHALLTSIELGLVGASVAVAVAALLMVHVQARSGSITGRALDVTTKAPGAVSHIIIGVAFLIAYSRPPFALYGTVTILLLAYVVMYMPQASVTAGDAIARVGPDLQEASAMSGASRGRTFRAVTLPLILPGLVAGWCMLFVLMVGDLTASALLSSTDSPVVGFAILEIWENGVVSQLAALAVCICVVSTTVVGAMLLVTGRGPRSRRQSKRPAR